MYGHLLKSAAVTAAGLAMAMGTATAAAAAPAPQRLPECVIVLAKLKPGEKFSRVISKECARDKKYLSTARASTLLMTLYEHRDYLGQTTQIRGDGGPCDREGYGFRSLGWLWNDVVSSFKTWNGCQYTTAYTNTNYGGEEDYYWTYTVPYVGDRMNDRIESIRVHA